MKKLFTLTIAFLFIGSLFSQANAHSAQYVHNTTTLQTDSNFNISGTGSAQIFNARGQYNLAGQRILSAPGTANVFVGIQAGNLTSTAYGNSFFGYQAGMNNTVGWENSFFGYQTGMSNTEGRFNVFYGTWAGRDNTTASDNVFVGGGAGRATTTGGFNSFFGAEAGRFNLTGQHNAFFGRFAGYNNVDGIFNTFVGVSAGDVNVGGNNNTAIGNSANLAQDGLTFATAVGSRAIVTASNSIQLGRAHLDAVAIGRLSTGGTTQVCVNAANVLSNCSSSIGYKNNIADFKNGLSIIKQLRPVSFNWKANDMFDFGLVAEEVAEIEPLLVNKNSDGKIEGVKYDRLGVVLINVVKQQQTQIENQEKTIRLQSKKIDALTDFICSQNKSAKFCS